jgi:outer membrane protein assembly factor BamB
MPDTCKSIATTGLSVSEGISPAVVPGTSDVIAVVAEMWSISIPRRSDETVFTANVVATNNLVFVSTTRAYAIDITTHQTVWIYPYTAQQLAISANGVLYLHRVDPTGESLVAINLQ